MKTEKATANRDYCVLWKWREALRLDGSPCTRAVGKHSGGLKKGDRMFVWATKDGELYLLGAIQVTRGGPDWAEGVNPFGKFQILPLRGLKWRLRFQNSPAVRLSPETQIAMQVRARRRPTTATVELLKRLLSSKSGRAATEAQGRKTSQKVHKPFTLGKIKSALIAIRSEISETQMSMLRAHYLHGVLSMERIAQFGGYDYFGSGNLQYGRLCGKIARQIGFKDRGKIHTIAEGAEPDRTGSFQWQMDEVVVKALEQLGWFAEAPKEEPAESRQQAVQFNETENEALRLARIGQGKFRAGVIALWKGCAVTKCPKCDVLVASHIVPWSECKTGAQRLDPLNGLLLTPNLDKLFDKRLISFGKDGYLLLSKELLKWSETERASLGLTSGLKLRNVPKGVEAYLGRHRNAFLRTS